MDASTFICLLLNQQQQSYTRKRKERGFGVRTFVVCPSMLCVYARSLVGFFSFFCKLMRKNIEVLFFTIATYKKRNTKIYNLNSFGRTSNSTKPIKSYFAINRKVLHFTLIYTLIILHTMYTLAEEEKLIFLLDIEVKVIFFLI